MARRGPSLSAEELYLRLRQVVAETPDLRVKSVSGELARWLGEAAVLVEESGDFADAVAFKVEANHLDSFASSGPSVIPVILYRALARAEAQAPASVRGTFIAAGRPLDALAAVSKILGEAKGAVLVVDAYAEGNLLNDYLVAVPERIHTRILADANGHKPTLKPTAVAWVKQFGSTRPLEVRVARKGELHDRLIFLDNSVVWVLGQSFNHLATRSHTSLIKADQDLAAMKITAYEQIWSASTSLL